MRTSWPANDSGALVKFADELLKLGKWALTSAPTAPDPTTKLVDTKNRIAKTKGFSLLTGSSVIKSLWLIIVTLNLS